MAAAAGEEIDYESDPEEAKLSMKMRRRAEASDDEAEEGGEIRGKPPRGAEDDSGGESEGAAAEYEDEYVEDYDLDEEYVEETEEADYNDGESGGGEGAKAAAVAVGRGDAGEDGDVTDEVKRVNDDAGEINDGNLNTEDGQLEVEKKEMEPYSVPTAGAFYMHDDRFRDSAGGRNRRMLGGRKLWESKDDMKWGHDKFEELTSQERTHQEHRRRGHRGRNRGRGRNRYAQENMPREVTNNGTKNNNQDSAPKSFRGRGPRRYQSSSKNKASLTQDKQPLWKSKEKPTYVRSEKTSESMSSAGPETVLPRKQVLASSLSIASPPFYPSGSSTKDHSGPSNELQAGTINRHGQPSTIGMDKLYIDDSLSVSTGKPANTGQMPLSGQLSLNSGRGKEPASLTQVNRVNSANQLQAAQGNHSQIRGQSSLQFTPRGSRASSPSETSGTASAVESLEAEPNRSKTALVPKGKGTTHGSGRGSFLYGGAHVMGASGNMSSGHGDPNFPAFLPVMQFGGQHPGGIGVPAVGMAFPGYVGQPQLGRGSSEMTWLPILTGPAGALGARYGAPFAVDDSYQARPSGQISSVKAASSKEHNTTNSVGEMDSARGPELENNDFGQRQKNPRRQVEYTEMKFDQ
ncbi:CASC3/Barentsz eIF4AIII binding [Striga asiatica]|uniref:CASC3/Barentsz eIF4AIII binding n=1 Tax=Striga asiatica TaxID=4170 RepID=A0A5A7P3Z9_STRAF|nr:CASC3/Barentsz eIF4AIII binding [Striga asiatica]